MQNKKKVLIINVLDKEYFNDCRIKGSVNVSLDDLKLYVDALDRLQPIVVYCADYMCSASSQAWYKLDEMGFSNLWAYEGGMAEWKQASLPCEGPCSLSYLNQEYEKPEHGESQVRVISKAQLQEMMKNS